MTEGKTRIDVLFCKEFPSLRTERVEQKRVTDRVMESVIPCVSLRGSYPGSYYFVKSLEVDGLKTQKIDFLEYQ